MSFVHLHVHTEFSLLDGSNKIKDYVKRVKELGMNAAAITDHGVMYGCIDFYRACLAEGIKPILGCEVYVAPGSRFDKEANAGDDRYCHLILLAENNKGYENLCKIVSAGFTEGYYYKPRVDMEVLEKYHEGLICTSACLAGEVQRLIMRGQLEEARACALRYLECFGEGNYYLELQDHGLREQQTVNMELIRLSHELNIPLVATNDCHYTTSEDAAAHDILLCLQTAKKLTDEDRMRYEGGINCTKTADGTQVLTGPFYVKSEEEMRELFPFAQEAIDNTQLIADRCNVEIEFGHTKLPHFEVPEGYDSWTYLNKLCMDGILERYGDVDRPAGETGQTYRQRLEYELDVIRTMGYVDYFLIVWDFINYAKQNDIPVGPGRGSAAGSIVSYALKITNLDPIRYGLVFERFLNPERVSMPDIDVDFCYSRRQEVIDYVSRKYGSEKVVQIVTFGTLAAKGVIRDVARVLDLPYSAGDTISKMIPNELNITLDKAIEMNPELRKLYEDVMGVDGGMLRTSNGTEITVHALIDYCKQLEGLPRHTSMHAAGVVICPKSADEFVPLSRGSDGAIVTQYIMTTLEELGLLKMDFLGLRTLTVIHDALNFVEKTTGKRIDIDNIDYADPAVYAHIGTGKCDGIFQLESGGMRSFMKELKPQNLEDVIAGISLYRPGPMDFIPKYIAAHKDAKNIKYDCPELKAILEPTYGCIVYQEQVMQIVRDLGGYTIGRSDLVRRAMSKKKQHVMEVERNNFVYGNPEENVPGCVSKGISETVANKIYDEMMDFAKYAFNKAHAACYAVVAYQTAYLKVYYPVEFMAALMTSVIDNSAKVSGYILSCKNLGIKLLPPDINQGEAGFAVQNGQIRYSLTAIKGVGYGVINNIVEERLARGPFKTLQDFITRTMDLDVNKRVIENLIKAGALDSLGGTRLQFMSIYTRIMDDIAHNKKNNMAGQISLFDLAAEEDKKDFDIALPNVGEYTKDMLLGFEKEVLGIYVSGHPLDAFRELWESTITRNTGDFRLDDETGAVIVPDGDTVVIGGLITEKKIKYTKNNKIMAFLTVEDLIGTVEVIVFPNSYDKDGQLLNEDAKVFIRGRSSIEEEKDAKVICEDVISFDDAKAKADAGEDVFPPRRGFGGRGNGGWNSNGGWNGNGGQAGFSWNSNSRKKAEPSKLQPADKELWKTKGLWIAFDNKEQYNSSLKNLLSLMADSDGNDDVVIYIKDGKGIFVLPPKYRVNADDALVAKLSEVYGAGNVAIKK